MAFISKKTAVEWAGSEAELARKLGITRQAVNYWNDDKPIPQKHAIALTQQYPRAFRQKKLDTWSGVN